MNNKYLKVISRLNSILLKYEYELRIESDNTIVFIIYHNGGKLKELYHSWNNIDTCLFEDIHSPITIFDMDFINIHLAKYLKAAEGSSLDEIIFNLDMLGV